MKQKPTSSGKYSKRMAIQDHWRKRVNVLFKSGHSAPSIAEILDLNYNFVNARITEIIVAEMEERQRLNIKYREVTTSLYGKQQPYHNDEMDYGIYTPVEFTDLSYDEQVIYLND